MATRKRRQAPGVDQTIDELMTRSYENLSPTMKLALDILVKKTIANVVDLYRQWYEDTKNPLYVWRAYQLSRQDQEMPQWIAEYFGSCAKQLLSLSPSKQFERDIAKACGFKSKGPKTFLSRYQQQSKKADAVMRFAALRQSKESATVEDALSKVAEEFKVDERTVARWVNEMRRFI